METKELKFVKKESPDGFLFYVVQPTYHGQILDVSFYFTNRSRMEQFRKSYKDCHTLNFWICLKNSCFFYTLAFCHKFLAGLSYGERVIHQSL